jgi:hypothetical protein
VATGLHLASVAPADLRGEPVTKIGAPLLSPSPAGARLGEQRPDGRGLKLGGPALSPRVELGRAPTAVRAAEIGAAAGPPHTLPAGVSRARGPPPRV